jgi:hypothetical protein
MAQASSASPVVFLSAKAAHYGDFSDGGLAIDNNRWVWVVVFKGTFHSHGPAPGPGQTFSPPADQPNIMVFIDYRTGAFIQASIPGPYVPDY